MAVEADGAGRPTAGHGRRGGSGGLYRLRQQRSQNGCWQAAHAAGAATGRAQNEQPGGGGAAGAAGRAAGQRRTCWSSRMCCLGRLPGALPSSASRFMPLSGGAGPCGLFMCRGARAAPRARQAGWPRGPARRQRPWRSRRRARFRCCRCRRRRRPLKRPSCRSCRRWKSPQRGRPCP